MSQVGGLQGLIVFSTCTVLSLVFAMHSQRKKKDVIQVDEIWVYPIKGCRGYRLNKARIAKTGFENDRCMMIANTQSSAGDNKFVSQRSHPKMALIQVNPSTDNSFLLQAPGMDDILVPFHEATSSCGKKLKVNVWGEIIDAVDMGDKIGSWLSLFLESPGLILVRMARDFVRKTDPRYAPEGQTSFSDGYPFLLASQSSLDKVNEKLEEKVHRKIFGLTLWCAIVAPLLKISGIILL